MVLQIQQGLSQAEIIPAGNDRVSYYRTVEDPKIYSVDLRQPALCAICRSSVCAVTDRSFIFC